MVATFVLVTRLAILLIFGITEVSLQAEVEPFVSTCIKAEAQSLATHTRLVDDTLLVEVVERHIIFGMLGTTGNRSLKRICRCVAVVHFLAPISIDAQGFHCIAGCIWYGSLDKVTICNILARIHHLNIVGGSLRPTVFETDINLGLFTKLTLLRCDNDNAVGSTRTVEGDRRSVLEHGDALDIVGVEGREHGLGHRGTIENEKRSCRRVKRV